MFRTNRLNVTSQKVLAKSNLAKVKLATEINILRVFTDLQAGIFARLATVIEKLRINFVTALWLWLYGLSLCLSCGPAAPRMPGPLIHPAQSIQSIEYVAQLRGEDFPCGPFNEPAGLASSIRGDLYVADSGNHRVCKFDAQQQFLLEFGRFGWGPGELQNPTDLIVDREVHLYIVDSGNNRLEKYSYEGVWLGTLAAVTDETRFERLYGIGQDRQGQIYVTDREADRLYIFDPTGRFRAMWGAFGDKPGYLNAPRGLWISAGGDVFVTDTGNGRVQTFNAVGNFKRDLTASTSRFMDKQPVAVCGDQAGNIFVADTEHGVLVFTGSGDFLRVLTDPRWRHPSGLTVDANKRLYIADSVENAVFIYQLIYQ